MTLDGTWNSNNQIDASNQPGLTADQVYTRNPQTGRPMPLDGRTLSVNGDLNLNGGVGQTYQNDINYVGGSGNLAQLQRDNYYLKTRLQQEDQLILRENQLIQQLEARLQGGSNANYLNGNQNYLNPNQNYLNPNPNYLNQNQNQMVYDQYGHLVPAYRANQTQLVQDQYGRWTTASQGMNQNQLVQDQYGRWVPASQGMNQNQLVQDQYGRWVPAYQAGLQQPGQVGAAFNWGNVGQVQLQTGGNYNPGYNPAYYQNPNAQIALAQGMQGQNNAAYLWQMEQAREQQALIASSYYQYGNNTSNYDYGAVNPPNYNYNYGNSAIASNYYPAYGPRLRIGNRNFSIGIGLG
jgi:hypothetical protein